MIFDDEQIADENSIADMKVRFAGLNSEKEDNSDILKLTELGRLLKREKKLFDFEIEENNMAGEFFVELCKVCELELEDLKKNFKLLNEMDKQTPEIIKKPDFLEETAKNLAKTEIVILEKLFELLEENLDKNTQDELKKIIKRRLRSFYVTFFGQQN